MTKNATLPGGSKLLLSVIEAKESLTYQAKLIGGYFAARKRQTSISKGMTGSRIGNKFGPYAFDNIERAVRSVVYMRLDSIDDIGADSTSTICIGLIGGKCFIASLRGESIALREHQYEFA